MFKSPDGLWMLVCFDLLLLVFIVATGWRRWSLHHPVVIYLFYHSYTVTWRAMSVASGAPLMYEGMPSFLPISHTEMARALIWSDVALGLLALASWLSNRHFVRHKMGGRLAVRVLDRTIANVVLWVCFLVGVGAFIVFRGSSADAGSVAGEGMRNYLLATTMWPATCMLCFVIIQRYLGLWMIPFGIYFLIVGTQGYHRFMMVLPGVSLIMIWLYNNNRRWPVWWATIAMIVGAMMFPYLKYIGRAVQEKDFAYAVALAKTSVGLGDELGFETTNEQFLDQYAGFLTMCDEYGSFEWGRSYLAMVTLPIPRAWWADKPGLADHVLIRSTPTRQYDKEGRIITYLGESYCNFMEFGMILIPALLGWILTRIYDRIFAVKELTLGKMVYFVSAPALIQVFRDGLPSALLFGFAFNMPILFIIATQYVTARRKYLVVRGGR